MRVVFYNAMVCLYVVVFSPLQLFIEHLFILHSAAGSHKEEFVDQLMKTYTSEAVYLLTTLVNMVRARSCDDDAERNFIDTITLEIFEVIICTCSVGGHHNATLKISQHCLFYFCFKGDSSDNNRCNISLSPPTLYLFDILYGDGKCIALVCSI